MSFQGYSFQLFYPQSPAIHARVLLVSLPFLALFFFSLLFVAGPITWAAGVRSGAFFTLAWTPLTVGVLATAGRVLGFFPENFVTEHAMQIGSGLEAFILTLALADRLYREREEKIRAQADALHKEKARNEAQNRLTEAMSHDPVTGLPNRNRFERMVNEQLQRDPGGHYMVGVARITRLDEINRTLGLSRSDMLLQRLASQMMDMARTLPFLHRNADSFGQQDIVYQLSGDTIGLLVNASEVHDNFDGLNNALKKLAEPVALDKLAVELHPRFGAASYPEHGDNAAVLIRNAHVGMEISPHGPYETGIYSQEYDIYSESRLTLMSDLREALQEDRTELYYQPKLCLASDSVIGLEALIRWNHAERGWVFPADFVPLAEDTGVITQLTRWVIKRGIRDLVSVELEEWILSALQHHEVKAERLTLELTETAVMEYPERGLAALKALADIGVKISIDDFGSGYSSLSYLKQLPATELKLDRSLIEDILTSESSKVIVQTAINMAHGLGYQLVAEGVESAQTARLLGDLGCDTLQGFWFCRPLPLSELREWLV